MAAKAAKRNSFFGSRNNELRKKSGKRGKGKKVRIRRERILNRLSEERPVGLAEVEPRRRSRGPLRQEREAKKDRKMVRA